MLGACARSPMVVNTPDLPGRVELTEVPFFAQLDYQCGPAALATMLNHRGIKADPDELVSRVYIPERKGSLQVEMVAAARAEGLLVYPLESRLETLLKEVASGNPVLVLQNLAFDQWPQWHFAVVVGYELAEQRLILRSGTSRRSVSSFRQFDRSWAKGGRWAVVTVETDRLPATARELTWLSAANDLELTGQEAVARTAYETATRRWSGGLSWFAWGNSLYAQGNVSAAEQALRRSLTRQPSLAAGWFNLGHVLAEQGCAAQAAEARACAVRLAPNDPRFAAEQAVGQDGTAICDPLPACPRN